MKNPFEEILRKEAFETYEGVLWMINAFEKMAAEGSGKACWNLSMIYSPSSVHMPDELKERFEVSEEKEVELLVKAYRLFEIEAAAGNGEAMHMLAIYYQVGFRQ